MNCILLSAAILSLSLPQMSESHKSLSLAFDVNCFWLLLAYHLIHHQSAYFFDFSTLFIHKMILIYEVLWRKWKGEACKSAHSWQFNLDSVKLHRFAAYFKNPHNSALPALTWSIWCSRWQNSDWIFFSTLDDLTLPPQPFIWKTQNQGTFTDDPLSV